MLGGILVKKVLLNLGFEKKYDLFEKRLKEAGFDVTRAGGRSPEEIIDIGKGCEVAIIGAEDQWNREWPERFSEIDCPLWCGAG